MFSSRKPRHSKIRLPAVLAIGFTGHRTLPDDTKCREWIHTFLSEKKTAHDVAVYGVSSVAAGADLLFAETCLHLEIPLRVFLPFPTDEFRKDFDDATWARAEHVMRSAVSVEVTGEHSLRDQRYYECGIETVQQSQLLLAVWNGQPASGLGGTEEIVNFARETGRPVVWCHSETGYLQIFNPEKADGSGHSAELTFLNDLPDGDVKLPADSPTALAHAWLVKIDANASRLAPQVRRLSAIPILCTATAALVSGAAARMPSPGTWLAIGAALGLAGAPLPALLRLSQRQSLWARTRTAAEVCRSVVALWNTPGTYQVTGPEAIPELAGMLMSLNLLKVMNGLPAGEPIDDFKERYRTERALHQIEYFASHAARAARQSKQYRVVSSWCAGIATAISIWVLASGAIGATVPVRGEKWFGFAASVLFQFATVSGALMIVHDCDRRRQRYREMHELLTGWDKELQTLKTWPTVLQVAVKIEKALLVEILEWEISDSPHKNAEEIGMKRILSLDGGGIRGVFSLEILLRMQQLLRASYGREDLVLADHFDMFAGTSTGAIIATCLCWGMPVEQILDLYEQQGRAMFHPVPWSRPLKKLLYARYESAPLSASLKSMFSEDAEGRVPALLGSQRLKKMLLVVVRNHSTGSAWPVSNNPKAKFNDPARPDCNLNIPLWKLVRGSTAAPVYFEPEKIDLGATSSLFVDGSITPYNNPSLIAALTAVLPSYNMEWPPGPEKIRLISLGTMRFSSALPKKVQKLWLGYNAASIPSALIHGIAWQQDYLCRCLGECLYGDHLDSELGDLIGLQVPGERWFSYVRYNRSYNTAEAEELLGTDPRLSRLDAVRAMPALREIGRVYANEHVKLEHL